MGQRILLGKLSNCRGVTCDGLASHSGGVEIPLATSCYRNWDKLRQLYEPVAQKLHFFLLCSVRRYVQCLDILDYSVFLPTQKTKETDQSKTINMCHGSARSAVLVCMYSDGHES